MDVGLRGARGKGLLAYIGVGNGSGPCRAAPVPGPEAVGAPRARGSSPGRPPRPGFLEKVAPPAAGPRSNPASDSPKTTYPAPHTHETSTSSRQGGDDQGGCGQGSPWQLLGSSVSKQQLRFGEGARCWRGLSAAPSCRYMITSLDRTHAGFYRCIVRNRMGALLQRQTEVQVACK